MSLVISSPQDSVQNRKNAVLFQWDTSLTNQYAYEFQYKLSTSDTWNTLGKKNGTQSSAFIDLSSLIDGVLYHYRIVVYYNTDDTVGSLYRGYEISQAYSIVLHTNKIGTLKIKVNEVRTEEIPLYNETNKEAPRFKVQIGTPSQESSGRVADNLSVSNFDINGEAVDFTSDFKIKIKEDEDAKRLLHDYGTFYYTGITPDGYREDRYTYLYFNPEKWTYAYDKTYWYYEYRSYFYISGYHDVYTHSTYYTEYDYTEDKSYYKSEVDGYTKVLDYSTKPYYASSGGSSQIAGYKYYVSGSHYEAYYKWVFVPQYVIHYKTVEVKHYRTDPDYSNRWYLYQYYEYYYNVYRDHYAYGYDYTNYTYAPNT